MTKRGRSARRRRAIRWIFFLVLVGALYVGVLRRFSLRLLDIATVDAMAPAMKRGARHLIDRSPAFALERGWVVWWTHSGGALFSRVVAVPGDRVEKREGRWAVREAGGAASLLRPEVALPDAWRGREMGLEEYLLLNDRLEEGWPDSRVLGPVRREDILARVLFPFGGGG